ncbi:unnamed protein product [Natator depressus]|uniref:C-X-C motif chemokine 16 n=1 Tax=Natator depressus TaxID=27790 RepID=UPI003D3CBB11
MAATPGPGATLLLLLLLGPPPAWGNEGGALGVCKCRRLTTPPGRLQDLADRVKGYQACGGHLVRFELPRVQICGLDSADWVIQLRHLWENKEAGRIDARQGGRGPAPNPTNAPLPPNTRPPMPSAARPPEPQGLTDGPQEPHGPSEPQGLTDGPPEPHGPPEPQGLTDGPPEPHGPPEPQGLTDGPPQRHGPLEPHRPTARPTDEALTTDPVGGPSLAPQQGEGAADGPPPAQPRPYLTAVPVLLGITLGLLGGLTYVLCRRSRRPPPLPGPAPRHPGTETLYHSCELG